jgi:hypothetical protein
LFGLGGRLGVHPSLVALIERFRAARDRGVAFIVDVLGPTLGVRLPRTPGEWVAICGEAGLYKVRWVNGVEVYAHGYGVELDFGGLVIDFDWGEAGEPDGVRRVAAVAFRPHKPGRRPLPGARGGPGLGRGRRHGGRVDAGPLLVLLAGPPGRPAARSNPALKPTPALRPGTQRRSSCGRGRLSLLFGYVRGFRCLGHSLQFSSDSRSGLLWGSSCWWRFSTVRPQSESRGRSMFTLSP